MEIIRRRQPLSSLTDSFSFPKKSRDKIKKLVLKSKTGFFCLGSSSHKSFNAITLPVQEIDSDGNIWFSISKSGYKGTKNKFVRLLFHGSAFSDFLVIEGSYIIFNDQQLKAPKVLKRKPVGEQLLIKVTPINAYS